MIGTAAATAREATAPAAEAAARAAGPGAATAVATLAARQRVAKQRLLRSDRRPRLLRRDRQRLRLRGRCVLLLDLLGCILRRRSRHPRLRRLQLIRKPHPRASSSSASVAACSGTWVRKLCRASGSPSFSAFASIRARASASMTRASSGRPAARSASACTRRSAASPASSAPRRSRIFEASSAASSAPLGFLHPVGLAPASRARAREAAADPASTRRRARRRRSPARRRGERVDVRERDQRDGSQTHVALKQAIGQRVLLDPERSSKRPRCARAKPRLCRAHATML